MPIKTAPLPCADLLRETLVYDPCNGSLTWRPRPREHFSTIGAYKVWNSRWSGKAAGWISKFGSREMRLHIVIDGGKFLAHRVVWKMMTGEDPPEEIDHRDNNPLNNSWVNLRLATRAQNTHNCRKRSDNLSGFKGVGWSKAKGVWRARISVDGVNRHLGHFSTREAAASAYEEAARCLHRDFASTTTTIAPSL